MKNEFNTLNFYRKEFTLEIKLGEDENYYYLELYINGIFKRQMRGKDLYKLKDKMHEYIRNEYGIITI